MRLRQRGKLRQPREQSQQEPPPQTGQQEAPLFNNEEGSEMASLRLSRRSPRKERPQATRRRNTRQSQTPRPKPRRERRSRRITLRRQRQRWKREIGWEETLRQHHLNIATKKLQQYKKQITNYFGYCADPSLPPWANKLDYIKRMTVEQYSSRPANMGCHDYCMIKAMPPGTKSLLGLGLKYCIKRPHPTNKLDNTINRFKNDVRRIHFFKMNSTEEDNGGYIPGLYIKSGWDPPLASDKIENCIVNFE